MRYENETWNKSKYTDHNAQMCESSREYRTENMRNGLN